MVFIFSVMENCVGYVLTIVATTFIQFDTLYYSIYIICTGSRPCPYDSDFRCANGVCIRSDWVCNRYNNCRDGSDEINCGK